MATGAISLRGEDLYCALADGGPEARIPCDRSLPRLREWAQRYDAASHRNREGELIAIGREMFGWLDETGWASAWADGPGERRLEIVAGAAESDDAAALLDARWELLARGHSPMALDDQMLQVIRRVGTPGAALEPAHGDIRLMFMAAAPAGQTVLDYEAEEAAFSARPVGSGDSNSWSRKPDRSRRWAAG